MNDYLEVIINEALPTIKENEFKANYLPLLFSDDLSAFNTAWLNNVARHPHASVNIVDNNSNVIITVPPLRISLLDSSNSTIADELALAERYSETNAMIGNAMLNKVINKLMLSQNEGYDSEHIAKWTALINHYGGHTSIPKPVKEPTSIVNYVDEEW